MKPDEVAEFADIFDSKNHIKVIPVSGKLYSIDSGK